MTSCLSKAERAKSRSENRSINMLIPHTCARKPTSEAQQLSLSGHILLRPHSTQWTDDDCSSTLRHPYTLHRSICQVGKAKAEASALVLESLLGWALESEWVGQAYPQP